MLHRRPRFRFEAQESFFAERKNSERQTPVFPAFGIPTLVAALAVQSPVHVETCDIFAPIIDLHMGTDIGTTETGAYNLRVRFANDGNQPITRVVFALNDGRTIVDAGTFAPGVMINHWFDLAPTNADSCHVESVTFADGTRWNAD
jgi:hypothetical protein